MKRIVSAVIFLLFINSASAYTYLNIYLENNGEALFLGETTEFLELPDGVSLNDGIIKGKTQELTTKQGEIWTFSYFLPEAEINVFLPENSVLKSLSDGDISIDGNQISIFSENGLEMTYILGSESSNSIFKYFIFTLIILIVLILIAYYIKKHLNKKNKSDNNKDILKNILSERENLILEKLKTTGKIKSSYLRKKTELPKATFARHIQELEKKKLIKRSGEGRNKFVELVPN